MMVNEAILSLAALPFARLLVVSSSPLAFHACLLAQYLDQGVLDAEDEVLLVVLNLYNISWDNFMSLVDQSKDTNIIVLDPFV